MDIHVQKNYIGPVAHTKINSEWIDNLILRAKLQNWEENIGMNLCGAGLGSGLSLDMENISNKKKQKNWISRKCKNFCALKDTTNKMRR